MASLEMPFDPFMMMANRPIPKKRVSEIEEEISEAEKYKSPMAFPSISSELEEGEILEETMDIPVAISHKNKLQISQREDILKRLRQKNIWITQCEDPLPYSKDSDYISESVSDYELESEEESKRKLESESDSEKEEEEKDDEEEAEQDEKEEEIEEEEIEEEDEDEEEETEIEEFTADEYDETKISQMPDLFDETVVFVICSEAKSEKPPGKGSVHEVLPADKKNEYIPGLSQHHDWRKRLCNSWVQPFTLKLPENLQKESGETREFQSVNHYLYFSAFSSQYDSNTELRDIMLNDHEKAEDIYTSKKWKGKKMPIDADWSDDRFSKEMVRALQAKFSQHNDLFVVLFATKNAKLMYRKTAVKQVIFYELMWLRKILEPSSLITKPLKPTEKPKKKKPEQETREKEGEEEKDKEKEGKEKPGVQKRINDNLEMVRLGEWERRLLKSQQSYRKIITEMPYYIYNRKKFIQNLNDLFAEYRVGDDDESGNISCSQLKNLSKGKTLLLHQKVVRDYLNLYTPYRGVLLYHGLGSGKTGSSVAIAEGFKTSKKIYVMLPAALKTNYWVEISKFGDPLFKKNQYWEFVSVESNPDLVPILAKALNLHTDEIRKRKGAWMVDVSKSPNFLDLTSEQQATVEIQIQEMINQKYTNINYNAPNLKTIIDNLIKNKDNQNPFDNSVIIVDEAHNLVSRIVNKLKDSNSIFYKLYHLIMEAVDCRVVLLSGTPIINYPNEMGVMFNLLRGYIRTWVFKVVVNTTKEITQKTVVDMLENAGLNTYDFIQYANNKLVVTRNPFGFVNTSSKTKVPLDKPKVPLDKTRRIPLEKTVPLRKTQKKQSPTNPLKTGGVGAEKPNYTGVIHSTEELMDDREFIQRFAEILEQNGLILKPFDSNQKNKFEPKLEKALYDSPEKFQETFIKDVVVSETDNALIHTDVLRNRILGLTSYFRSAQEKLLPRIVPNEKGDDFHVVEVPMSDYQLSQYAVIRKEEYDREKANAKKKRMQNPNNGIETNTLFNVASSYRIFSRACCNFAFPENIPRPHPPSTKNTEDETTDGNELVAVADSEEANPEVPETYQNIITNTMQKLKSESTSIFSEKGLQTYSPKFLEIMRRIQSPENHGLHLLYSNFRTLEGIGLFQYVLEKNGMTEFKVKKQSGKWVIEPESLDASTGYKFVLYTGTESEEQKEIVRNIYNGAWDALSPELRDQLTEFDSKNTKNADGSIIKLFMITSAGAEGINLQNTRFVHIMEPYWHNVRLEQVIGRARRICSHEDLPEEDRTVQVFIYLSVFSDKQKKNDKFTELFINDVSKKNINKSITTDENLFEIATIKTSINQQFLRLMKETAMDCSLYVSKHNKQEKKPLVCYGFGKVNTNEFASHPILETDIQDSTKGVGVAATETNIPITRYEKWKGVVKVIDGKKYAMNPDTNELYDLNNYKNNILTFEGIYDPAENKMIIAAELDRRPKAIVDKPKAIVDNLGERQEPNKALAKTLAILDIQKAPMVDIKENYLNTSYPLGKCKFVVFFPEKIKPAIFPFVTNERNLELIIKTSCQIQPTQDSNYESQYNKDKFAAKVYQNIRKKDILTSIDYVFQKMKTGVFVRICNNILVNFIVLYNLEYTNDFADLIQFQNGMTAKEYFQKKDPKGKGKWQYDVSKWNSTNCLLRNEAEDDSPTLAYLSVFYDMIVETLHHRTVSDCIFFLNRKDFPYLDSNWNESYDQIYGDNAAMKAPWNGSPFVPILSQSTSKRHADIPIPTGDDWENISQKLFANKTKNYVSESKTGFGCTNGYLLTEDFKIPEWEKRDTVFFWRGMATGCGNSTQNNPRLKISKMSEEMQKTGGNKYPLDAGIVNFTRRDKKIKTEPYVSFTENTEKINILKPVDRFDQLKYKFMLNIEGNSAAYRYGSLFKFGFCVINVVSQYTLWFEPFLEDRVHCIFVKPDLSDLQEIMQWCLDHDAECKKIAENGRKFYDKYFNKEFVYDYLSDIFNKTSSLLSRTGWNSEKEFEFVSYSNIIKPEMEKYKKRYRLETNIFKISNIPARPNKSTVLIVPFRENPYQNRGEQLQKFIQHYTNAEIGLPIIVVTQSNDGRGFNRGALLNAGYDYLLRCGKKMDSVIFHDVDLLFPKEFVLKYYGNASQDREIVHYGKNVKDYYDYPDFLGGAIQFSRKSFQDINGFPNHIYGWGGEDDALKVRIVSNNLKVYRPKEDKVDAEIPLGPGQKETKDIPEMIAKFKNEDLLLDEMIWKMNGLNSLHYKVIEKKEMSVGVYQIVVDLK